MNLKKLFGINVKKFRKERKLTQAVLAEMANVEPKHVSCIENGLAFPSADLIPRLASALKIEPYELFIVKEKPTPKEIKQELTKIINNTSNENLEQIYLYAKFIAG